MLTIIVINNRTVTVDHSIISRLLLVLVFLLLLIMLSLQAKQSVDEHLFVG